MHDRICSVLELKGRTVYTCSPKDSVFDATTVMNERRIGSLVVEVRGAPIGIITERDVLVRVLAAGLDAKATLVALVMTRELISVTPETRVTDAMALMTTYRVRHLPVIDHGLRGLISIGDLTSWVVRDQQRRIDDLHDYIRAA